MNCIFDVNNLLNSLKNLKRDVFKRLFSIKKTLSTEEKKNQALKLISELSESYLINPSTVDAAMEAFDGKILTSLGDAIPSKEELREAMLSWQKPAIKTEENTSTQRLDNQEKNPQRVIDNPIDYYYGRALRAKIRALQHANTVGVHSILYNENGIINDTVELNAAIKYEQEKLFENVLKYLESQGIYYFSGKKIYGENNKYTGVLEEIQDRVGGLFRIDFNELNNMYNNGDFDTLDAISSWVILTNFDTLLKLTFGKAIDINPDKPKYSIGKYSVGGGSNVYTTWRTNEEIDLSKEINNISLSIVTSLPYYLADLNVPSNNRNLKFNEFLYLISKIKDIPIHINEDFIFSSNLGIELSPEAMEFFEGKSVFSIISTLRENPQEKIPYLIELLNNRNAFDIINEKLGRNYFESTDREIINTLYLGLFNKFNPSSLISLQEKNGYNKTNYFAFITLTIDSMFKSNFLQYFRNSDGEIYVRPMYDLSISRIESDITGGINRLNSKIMADNYLSIHEKYDTRDDVPETFDYNNLKTTLTYIPVDGTTYLITKTGEIFSIKDPEGKDVTDKDILAKINQKAKETFSIPSVVKYTIKDFHAGRLEVEVNLNDGKISYLVDGKEYLFLTKKDFDSLSLIILDILKQNFDIDNDYLTAFGNRLAVKGTSFYGALSQNLMQLVSRVITNQYIQQNYMKGTTPASIKSRIDEIYKSTIGKPTYNKREGELNFITDSETSIIRNLALAKALVTGRLTSSQILDGEGNALASSNLSRLLSSLLYQVEVLVKQPNAAASEFSLWKPGVYKGVSQLKEYKEGTTSKSHINFSNKEMENSLIFIDFLQGLITVGSTKSPYTDGVVGFYPSENSDKTYIGRLLIDLKNVLVGDSNLYELIKENPSNIEKFWPIILKELGDFYTKALLNINNEWARVGQELGINISYGDWSELNTLAELETFDRGHKVTPIQLVKEAVTNYNFNHPQNPIVLTEEVHYVQKKDGSLMINSSFEANLLRLSPTNFLNFMYEQERDVLENLLLDGLEVDATPELIKLLGNEWIDPYTNKIILAKYYDPMSGEYVGDIRKYSEYDRNNLYIRINPLISAYNSLNYFFTQEYMNSSVGAYYAHSNKKAEDIGEKLANGEISLQLAHFMYLADEAARKLALDKRNVSFTAAMHEFLLNLLHGIPTEINVAAMPDPKDYFETVSGDYYDIKPFDGATFTNPFFLILLNYSLGGARVGLIKKTFTHYYDEKTGTGGIIKTAEFPLNNEYIRRSRFYEIMMLNMTDRIWRDLNGEIAQPIDITKDYNGNNIDFKNIDSVDGTTYYQDSVTGEYYAFVILSLGNNQYQRIIQRVDEHGIPQEEAHPEVKDGENVIWTVDTNYKLWKLLGGERSMAFNKGKFFQSEYSINQVVKIMNNTGTILSKDGKVRFLKDLWQPLKHSDIHIMPTAGAVKQGIANINDLSTYYTADASKINHMRIRMNQAGILLDKEHHADGEDLSIMTLVLSACAARGYTQEQCQQLYNAMASLAKAGIRPYLKSFEEFFKVSSNKNATPELLEEARQKFENTLLDTLVKALANSTNTSGTLQIITQELLDKAKEGKEIQLADTKIPLSDPSVMRKLHSTISVALTKAAIKIKVDGSLNVLCPSFGVVKVYNGKMRENYLNDSQILEEQEEWNLNPASELINRVSDIKLGRTYKVVYNDGTTVLKHIRTTGDYYKLKEELSKITSIKELFASTIIASEFFEGGRELASYNITFSGNTVVNQEDADLLGGLAQSLTLHFNLYDLVSVKHLHDLKESETATKEQINEALAELQKDLMVLHNRNGQVLTDQGLVEINPESVQVEPYEIVLPKIFATVFGLNTEDDLESIKKNPNFFLERLLDNLKPTHNNYTLALQRVNGNHVYILNSDDAILTDNFRPKEINKRRENGKLYRQIGENLEYELGEDDLVWEYVSPDGNAYEVIVTDDPTSYLNRVDYITLNINLNLNPEKLEQLVNELRNSKNKAVVNYIEAIDGLLTREGETLQNAIEDVQEVTKHTYNDSPVGIWYKKLGNQIYASFLKSLEVVAARIPAQSMLSFMPMKAAGFEKSDRNTAYVSTTQFLFEGSDLDIDAVSLASFAFDKSGRYIIHSPLANIDSYELLKESLKIPFPSGIKLDFNYREQYDYNNIIRTKSEKELRESGISEEEILREMAKPFYMVRGNQIQVINQTPSLIRNLTKFIKQINKLGYLPSSEEFSELIIGNILGIVNRHNDYINTSKDVEEFSKNYIVSAMYDIGLSPANMIESLQAMDSITGPLKEVGNSTAKAKSDSNSLSNPANFVTNIRGLVLNMDGKQGVGICAVGLKGFFAATARYNEVLANGTPEEIERLKSDVQIAGKHFRMLANAYSNNEVNTAILGEILTQLDLGTDAALVLSGLLSLSTDNAKELQLSKLNASNMLGMYIYGITIGMDFREIAKIIASKTGQVIDSLSKDDIINGNKGKSMENIFDYLELGPTLASSTSLIPESVKTNYAKILSNKEVIRDMAWNHTIKGIKYTKNEIIKYLDNLKIYPTKSIDPEHDTYDGVIEYNRNIEKLLNYIEYVNDIVSDGEEIHGTWRSFNTLNPEGKWKTPNLGIYGELKKLYQGGEEMRRLGLMLHINQGNETSYSKALNYIDTIESAISSAQYRKYRERSRKELLAGNNRPNDYSELYEFNFHKFVFDSDYREGIIDLYDGKCNLNLFKKSESYREPFLKKLGKNNTPSDIEELYNAVTKNLYPSKTFLNILDILQVPHYMEYIRSADLLHQLMQNSIKYRSIYKLGKRAIQEIGAYSQDDREKIFRRTEEYIDRLIRDRFFINRGLKFDIPVGLDYFVGPNIERIPAKEGAQIKLGTREGNASFKLLMETVIIPELKRNPKFKDNKFILSLGTVSFSFNPELLTTVGYAPNINMSPRSESDRALFEEIKYDFNRLRTTDYKYLSGGIKHDLIDLFYYYNLITFGGRVGENTLTNIFQDVLDYRNIKNFRDFEAELDKHGNFELADEGVEGNISLDTLIREVAPRANQFNTNLNYFYDEDYKTGKLNFYEKNKTRSYIDDSGRTIKLSKYSGTSVNFTTEEDYKNYMVQSSESDVHLAHFNLSTGQKVQIKLEKGAITEIFIDEQSIQIPLADESFFKKLPVITKITSEGIMEKYYNKNLIISKIEEIVSCKL